MWDQTTLPEHRGNVQDGLVGKQLPHDILKQDNFRCLLGDIHITRQLLEHIAWQTPEPTLGRVVQDGQRLANFQKTDG